jgi:hypothetical protein
VKNAGWGSNSGRTLIIANEREIGGSRGYSVSRPPTAPNSNFDREDRPGLVRYNKPPCVQNVRKDPTDRLGCLISGSPLPIDEGVLQPRGKARVWVAPRHSLPPTGNQQYPRGVNSKPIIMDIKSRTPLCIFSFMYIFVSERRKTGVGLGLLRQCTSKRRRAPVRSTRESRVARRATPTVPRCGFALYG